ncbi:hypothetical protein VKT23_010448 [Stygiomarasmius scandens]|uniref:RRM domain-containing protein n=1 Tax=Marasmiellus scandens TaxID=2682957 RepID=A0ABR1JFS6_9AGAR
MTTPKPHPLLKRPLFFIQRVPSNVHHDDLLQIFPDFATNATVTLTQASSRRSKPGDQVARVSFPDLETAEKVMALLRSRTMPTTTRSINFCLREKSFPIKPRPVVTPRLFRYQSSDLTRSVIYDILRPFGPVFSICVEEQQSAASVVFWNEEDANAAVESLSKWRTEGGAQLWPVDTRDPQSSEPSDETPLDTTSAQGADIPAPNSVPGPSRPPKPTVYGPCRVFCTFLPLQLDDAEFRKIFEEFGHVISTELHQRRKYGHGIVTFQNREDARRAVNILNGSRLMKKRITVRLERQDVDGVDQSINFEYQGEQSFDEARTSQAQPDQDSSGFSRPDVTLSPTDSQATLADPSFADIGVPPRPSYSGAAPAPLPRPTTTKDADNHQEPSITVDKLSHLLSQTWKSEADKLRSELTELQARERKLAEDWAKESKEKQKQQEKKTKDREEIEKLKKQNEQLKQENTRLEKQLGLKVEAEKREKENVDKAQQEIYKLRVEVASHRNREEELEEQVECLTEELGMVQEENTVLRGEATSFGRQEDELVEKIADLTEELQENKDIQEGMKSKIAELDRQLRLSESRRKVLELEADRPKWEEAKRKREAAERLEREKEEQRKQRQKELDEAKRRMQELERKEREEKERKRAAEEQRRREEEARERAAKEQKRREEEARERAAEEQKRREEEKRKKEEEGRKTRELFEELKGIAWKQATETEVWRCQLRDRKWMSLRWDTDSALSRFKLIMDEFGQAIFSTSKPMTILSIPWPVLKSPFQFFTVEDVQWDSVEKFFEAIRQKVTLSEYKALVERSHKMFHPDRWRSRNLLSSVMLEDERRSLERAGNIVSQALTPIWRNSRG